ncbi:hypothetical protein [Actinoplanes sp. NPDC049681]|uniref:hypothetical protein n=1 Tax=Actinoplanes sp. NPDC049681 TaxID=3363905 RepID=UPI00378BB6B9
MPGTDGAEARAQQDADMRRLARSLHHAASAAGRSEIVSLVDEVIVLLDRPEGPVSTVDHDAEDRGSHTALRLIDRVLQGIPL